MELINEIEKAFENECAVTVLAADDNLVELVRTLEEHRIYWGGVSSSASLEEIYSYSIKHSPPGVNICKNWDNLGRHSFFFLDASHSVQPRMIEFGSNNYPSIEANEILGFLEV